MALAWALYRGRLITNHLIINHSSSMRRDFLREWKMLSNDKSEKGRALRQLSPPRAPALSVISVMWRSRKSKRSLYKDLGLSVIPTLSWLVYGWNFGHLKEASLSELICNYVLDIIYSFSIGYRLVILRFDFLKNRKLMSILSIFFIQSYFTNHPIYKQNFSLGTYSIFHLIVRDT